MSKKKSSWLDDMQSFEKIAVETAFNAGDSYWSHEYFAHSNNAAHVVTNVKIRAKEDETRLTNIRIPAQLEAVLAQIAPGVPIATALLVLADLKASELVKENKAVKISNKGE
ncbi:hypothetical protein DDJ70_29645 [Klebsiella michiganensis]|uniref:hypothetical protein n=1 Tax=Klebsiella michiganensis TaxID=1134687 RepID=UPI000E2A11AE|nr:hypothetical protein [Klebsiella michiganensis]RFC02426.1 hypothetical protein DDJ70_29645 [Klebsiella michiganensis]